MGLMEKRDVSMKLIKHIKKQSVWVLSVIAPQGFQNVSRPIWFSNLWLIAASSDSFRLWGFQRGGGYATINKVVIVTGGLNLRS